MKLDKSWVLGLKGTDTKDITFRKVQFETSREYACGGTTGTVFKGFFSSVRGASNPPHLPAYIRFVDQTIMSEIPDMVSSELEQEISILDFNWIEFLD